MPVACCAAFALIVVLHKFPAVLQGPARLFFSKEKLLAVTLAGDHLPAKAARENAPENIPQVNTQGMLAIEMLW